MGTAAQNRPWVPHAGGQDDGSLHTNSLKLWIIQWRCVASLKGSHSMVCEDQNIVREDWNMIPEDWKMVREYILGSFWGHLGCILESF